MANASVSGLASGLDTASIISQLMQLEAVSQNRLKSRVTTEQGKVKALQELNTKLAALATAADRLVRPTAWNPVAVTSSSDRVGVTAGPAAAPGTVSLTVDRLARSHTLTFGDTAGLADPVTGGSALVRLERADGTGLDLDTGDGTLTGLVNALNGPGTGVKASTVRLADGSYRLRVASVATGAASAFTLRAADGADLLGGATVTAGQDARITLGSDTVHSPTNTFTGVVSGLEITLQPGVVEGTAVDLTVTQDRTAVTASATSLVDAVNGVLGEIDRLTAPRGATGAGGVLAGDGALRALRATLVQSVFPADGTTMASVGLQTDRYGKLVLDKEALGAALAADPAAVTAAFAGAGSGFAARVHAVARGASDPVDGTVTAAVKGRDADIGRLKDGIEAWDTRLALRRATLTRQFTALETALSQLSGQSSWLAAQISSLSSLKSD